MDVPWSPRLCRMAAVLLIVGSAALRLVYLACNCPLDLAPDEAHYWDWSRHLDWSYYSKGPGVAWLIRLSCELFGGLSVHLTGNEMLAVRLPAVLCGGLLLLALYILTLQVGGGDRVALLVVAIALTAPALSAGSTLMTIDAPYACCWGWALVAGHRAVFRRSLWAWAAAGALVGLGILFKYTMVVWLPSLAAFLLFSGEYRWLLRSRGFWLLCGLASLSGVPILIWNALNGWVTFHHVSGLAGLRSEEPTFHWLGPLQFVGVQCGLWMVFWFLAWARAMFVHAPWRPSRPSLQYLWWMSAPMFGVFLGFSFKTGGGQPNWPITAFISGMILATVWLVDELRTAGAWYRRLTLAGATAAAAVGVMLTLFMHFSAWAHPVLAAAAGPATAEQPYPLRRLDPTLRLRGWRTLAAEVDHLRHQLRAQGREPILAGTGWNLPGLLGFYCEDHPTVYSLGPALGDRRSQYDFWRPNPIADADTFAGRTFLIIAGQPLDLRGTFEDVQVHPVHCEVDGRPVAGWVILICRGYRGFGPTLDPSRNPHF
jgi:4-amino-4-deoxy-L-arabinose transferase-like glycosyltransferase